VAIMADGSFGRDGTINLNNGYEKS